MESTDGLQRGLTVVDTGAPIKVPVGLGTLGRVFNVWVKPSIWRAVPDDFRRESIHRKAPTFDQLSSNFEIRKQASRSSIYWLLI